MEFEYWDVLMSLGMATSRAACYWLYVNNIQSSLSESFKTEHYSTERNSWWIMRS